MASEVGLKRPQMTSSVIKRPNNWDFLLLTYYGGRWTGSGPNPLKWMDIGQIRVYGLGGHYMASGRPRRSASSGLKQPQMTSILLKKLKFVNFSCKIQFSYYRSGPEVDLTHLNSCIWPRRSLYGLGGRPQVASNDLKRPQMTLTRYKWGYKSDFRVLLHFFYQIFSDFGQKSLKFSVLFENI